MIATSPLVDEYLAHALTHFGSEPESLSQNRCNYLGKVLKGFRRGELEVVDLC